MSNDQQPVSHPGAHEYVLEYSVFTFRTENSVPSGRGTRILVYVHAVPVVHMRTPRGGFMIERIEGNAR